MARADSDKDTSGKSAADKNDNSAGQRQHEERSSVTEKIFTVFSVILVGGLCIFLLSQSFSPPAPPAFAVETAYPINRGENTAIDVYIRNSGKQAAKAVHITGEMPGADGKPVEAEATLDWLPGNSRRQVTLLFPADVQKSGNPEIRVKGYEEP